MAFSYKANVLSPCQDMDEQKFWELVNDPQTRRNIETHRLYSKAPPGVEPATAQKLANRAKRMLPSAIWQARFEPGKMNHNDADCEPTGFFALDIDHVEDPRALFATWEGKLEELYVTLVHITPSGHGLRVVAQCNPDFQTLAQNQAWLAHALATDYDAVCHNWSRIWFLPIPEEILYYNKEMWS